MHTVPIISTSLKRHHILSIYTHLSLLQILKTWTVTISGVQHRVVLEKDTLDVWVDSSKVETAGEFFDGGAETHFTIDNQPAHIKAVSSGNRHKGLIHSLFLENEEVPASVANHFSS